MAAAEDAAKVAANIISIFDRRKFAVLALAKEYAALMLQWFRGQQSGNKFWNNDTTDAMRFMMADGYFKGQNTIAMGMAHGVFYGIYLELANNRRHSALTPAMKEFAWQFLRAVQRLYKDG